MRVDKNKFTCAIARSVNLLGDKWSLLILRDIILHKKSKFREFLSSKEKIATNILADRLKFLLEECFIEKLNPYGTKKSTQYIATNEGLLTLPIIIELYLFSINSIDVSVLNEDQIQIKNNLLANRNSYETNVKQEYIEFVKVMKKSVLQNS